MVDKMLIMILVPLITAFFTAMILKNRKVVWTLFLAVSGFLSYTLLTMYGAWNLTWSIELGFKIFDSNLVLSLSNNPLGWFFAFFASVTTMLIAMFSIAFNDEKHDSKTAPIWLILMVANIGIFFAKDWIMFFGMWEMMSMSSYFIIAHGKEISAKAAKFYLTLSLIGTSSLLLGIILVARLSQTFDINASIASLINLFSSDYSGTLLYIGLFTVAFFIKSAAFPFYMWPAKAYAEAPDDFTPFLSSVMSKYGVYGIALFVLPIIQNADIPALGNINEPAYILAWLGAITSVLGTLLAIFETDMKRLFAYSSVANIG
ncbi:MAG: NADH-quinone oxidoreductase subunit M, partial [Peptostreptococcaceae bacterium]|nr:NADH-quinone oxidoreductase subunit M [Peptostreptococcaceae bacterium]